MNDIDLEVLEKIDKVNSLIKKLAEDSNVNESTYSEIDEFLLNQNTKSKEFNRTIINKSNGSNQDISKESFMRDIEQDAKERAKRKAEAKSKADLMKTKANDYYKANDFEKAIKYYTRAINECRDYEILYTNRAQAFLKTDKIKEALDDCEFALRITPDNHKAMLHKGRALVRLNRYDEAIENYNQVLKIAPNLTKYMKEFFDEANKLKILLEIKTNSINAFESKSRKENRLFDEVIDKLLSETYVAIEYYVGGLELLIQELNNDNDKVESLRVDMTNHNRIFSDKSQIQIKLKGIWSKKSDNISDLEWSFLSLWIELFKKLTHDNELMTMNLFNDPSIVTCLEFCCKSVRTIPFFLLSPIIYLLYHISRIDIGLQQLFDKFPIKNIISITLAAINLDHKHYLINVGMDLFHNLVQSQRLKIALGKDDELIVSVIDCLHAIFVANVTQDSRALSTLISIIEILADNSTIRLRLIKHQKFLDDCMNTIEARLPIHDDQKHSSILLELFTMIHNLLIRSKNCLVGDKIRIICNRIVQASSYLLSNHTPSEMRSVLIQVLSQMLVTFPEEKLKSWCEDCISTSSGDGDNVSMCRSLSRQSSLTDIGFLDKVCKPLKLCITILDARNHPLLPHAIKILTLASKVNEAIRFLCCDVRDRVLKLHSLLYNDKEKLDDVLSGNICLLFINCVGETPLAEHLSNTSVIKDLLRICADANKADCRRNSAILAGKLAQSNHMHRAELSRLNGYSIISKFNN